MQLSYACTGALHSVASFEPHGGVQAAGQHFSASCSDKGATSRLHNMNVLALHRKCCSVIRVPNDLWMFQAHMHPDIQNP